MSAPKWSMKGRVRSLSRPKRPDAARRRSIIGRQASCARPRRPLSGPSPVVTDRAPDRTRPSRRLGRRQRTRAGPRWSRASDQASMSGRRRVLPEPSRSVSQRAPLVSSHRRPVTPTFSTCPAHDGRWPPVHRRWQDLDGPWPVERRIEPLRDGIWLGVEPTCLAVDRRSSGVNRAGPGRAGRCSGVARTWRRKSGLAHPWTPGLRTQA